MCQEVGSGGEDGEGSAREGQGWRGGCLDHGVVLKVLIVVFSGI